LFDDKLTASTIFLLKGETAKERSTPQWSASVDVFPTKYLRCLRINDILR